MSETLERVKALVAAGHVVVSRHGARELDNDEVYPPEVIEALDRAIVVEDYPEHSRGSCVLVLQRDKDGNPVHVVWGLHRENKSLAVLVTGYPIPTNGRQTG